MQSLGLVCMAGAAGILRRHHACEEIYRWPRQRVSAAGPAGIGAGVVPSETARPLVVKDGVAGIPDRHHGWTEVDIAPATGTPHVRPVRFAVVLGTGEGRDAWAVRTRHLVLTIEGDRSFLKVVHSSHPARMPRQWVPDDVGKTPSYRGLHMGPAAASTETHTPVAGDRIRPTPTARISTLGRGSRRPA